MADPEVIGHYRLLTPLAEGSMGKVYLVEHEVTKRKLAMKLLKPELFGGERARQRFLLEARAAGIEHPNLIQVTDAGEDDGRLYIVMRYVRGLDLGRALRRGPLPPERAATILSQIASALDASHEAGLIHRDVKPSNILVTSEEDPEGPDHAFLCDFGITKDAAGPSLTQTGFAPGTRAYMAPEQFKGSGIEGRSDQYALACVAYEVLTGRRPFEAPTEETLMYKHLNEDPPAATSVNSRLNTKVDQVLANAMSKDTASRYASCAAFTQALSEALDAIEPEEPPVDISETPTVVSVAPSEGAEAAPGSVVRTKRGSRTGVTVAVVLLVAAAVVAVGGGAKMLSRSRSDGARTADPVVSRTVVPGSSPASISPSPVPEQTAAEARLRGPYRLVLQYTGSRGLSPAGSPFWHTWPIIMKPACDQGACNARIDFRRFGIIASGSLKRTGSTYAGSLSTFGITTCNGRNSYGTLRVLLRVIDGRVDGSTWLADDLSGRMRYDSAQGACIPAAWTADVSGVPRE